MMKLNKLKFRTWILAVEKCETLKSTDTVIRPAEEKMAAAPTVSIKIAIAPVCQFPSLSFNVSKAKENNSHDMIDI